MTESAQLAELLTRFQAATPEARAAMLRAATGADRRRPGTLRQAAEILQTHPRTVQRLARRGLLHPIRLSARLVRWDLREVQDLAERGV